MQRTVYEIVPSGSEWVLRREGSATAKSFSTKKEAVARGREECRANRPSLLRVKGSRHSND